MPKPTTLSERFAQYEQSSNKSNKKNKSTKTNKSKIQPNKPKVAFKKARPKKISKKKIQLTAGQLDKELEAYRLKDKDAFKSALDKELEDYNKQGSTTTTTVAPAAAVQEPK